MRLLEESKPAGNGKGDSGPGQLELHFQRLKMGPIQDRHLVEINPLISQFENTLANERGLLVVIYEGDQRRLDLKTFALRAQRFRELFGIRLDCVRV